MSVKITVVDAFTDQPFRGNPAAVCVLPEWKPDAWLQSVAAEMNLSETAFLVADGKGVFHLRWFTPVIEVDLCGHATLASAHLLWTLGLLPGNTQARFDTRSGLLTADRKGDWIELDFPSMPAEEMTPPVGLALAFGGASFRFAGKNATDYLVELETEEQVRKLRPDFALLAGVPMRGVIATARSSSGDYDFVSRFFAPGSGINEDPVTGSAHCCLAPFWAARLGKNDLKAYQASARGGTLILRNDGARVKIRGQAVTVLNGELNA